VHSGDPITTYRFFLQSFDILNANEMPVNLLRKLRHSKLRLYASTVLGLRLGYAVRYKRVRAFLKVNKLFKTLSVTVDAQNFTLMI
jgi:hypothetical protein